MKSPILLLICIVAWSSLQAQDPTKEVQAVEEACFDYIHAFYKADTTLAYRSIHKSLRKTGFRWIKQKEMYSEQKELPFNDFISLVKRWNADGSRA
ncbi:MAG: hypothetical protein HKN89_00890, partial [Eudoraea sp.]|nr:hypothetical protein [Eudoraea sp.]